MRKQEIEYILTSMLDAFDNVSDLNISVGNPFRAERSGHLVGVEINPPFYELTPFQTEIFALTLINQDYHLTETLLSKGMCDLSYRVSGKVSFMVNIFLQRNTYSITLRKQETDLRPEWDDIELPDISLEDILESSAKSPAKKATEKNLDVKRKAKDSADASDIDFEGLHPDSKAGPKKGDARHSHAEVTYLPDSKDKDQVYYGDDTIEEGDLTQIFDMGLRKNGDKKSKSGGKKRSPLEVIKKLGKLFKSED